MFENLFEDSRIELILKNLNKGCYDNFSKNKSTDRLTPNKINFAADIHFPLCAKQMHIGLKKDRKFKHGSRR